MMVRQAMIQFITKRDHRIMRRVHKWPAPRWVRLWMICATRGGDGWLWYTLLIALSILGGPDRFYAIGAAMLSTGLGIALFLFLKRLTGRRRPCHIEPHCWSTLLPPDQFSFPSGHTITAFAMAVSVSSFYPDLAPGLYFVALSIGASRILLGMHFFSDVLAGAALGSALAYWTSHLFGG
jgi:undecaprenyl-diphosphatase